MNRSEIIEAMARSRHPRWNDLSQLTKANLCREQTRALTALEAAIPGLADVLDGKATIVPNEADELQAYAMRDATRATQVSGIGGQTVDAVFRNNFAREFAAYRSALAASPYRRPTDDRE